MLEPLRLFLWCSKNLETAMIWVHTSTKNKILETERQKDRKTERQKDRKTERQKKLQLFNLLFTRKLFLRMASMVIIFPVPTEQKVFAVYVCLRVF